MMFINSLRTQLLVVSLGTLALIGGFGFLTVATYVKYQDINRQLNNSYYLEEVAKELNLQGFDQNKYDRLMVRAAQLKPQFRRKSYEHVLKAYKDKQFWVIPGRAREFVEGEKQFRESRVKGVTPYLEKRIKYYGLICLFLTLLAVTSFIIFPLKKIFSPLRDLKTKMVDFLNDKYSYQFTVPAPNEIGHLQATFNALAQRVLHNMEDLKSLDKAKSEFLSIASHELRTPLTSIKGSLSLLNSGIVGKFDEPALNLIRIAEGESDRLIRLINDLLDLAKIEARKLPLNCEWHPLKEVVEQTIESMNGLCLTAEVQLEANEFDDVEVYMDKDRIQQVLTNLLSNAIKYSPKKKTVSLNISLNEESELLIEVNDQGKGIAPEDQELIFEQFRQATGPKNPLVKGTGLGLAIAKALVDEHKGQIGVKSWPKKGSTFFFTLSEWRPLSNIEVESTEMAA